MSDQAPEFERTHLGPVTVEKTPTTLRLAVEPPGAIRLVEASALVLGVVMELAALLFSQTHHPLQALALFLLVYGGAVPLGWSIHRMSKRHAVESVYSFPAGLEITVWRWSGRQRTRWLRADLAAVGAWDGLLLVAADGRFERLFAKTPLLTQRCLAGLLQEFHQVGERLPLGPGESAVQFSGSFWDEPVPGVLTVTPGVMALRHPLSATPVAVFRTRRDFWSREVAAFVLVLDAIDVVCRVEDDGRRSVLKVAPAGARAEIKHGMGRLRTPIVAPILNRHQDLPKGCLQTENFLDRVEDFEMSIWCDDAETLQEALGRFWGDGEHD